MVTYIDENNIFVSDVFCSLNLMSINKARNLLKKKNRKKNNNNNIAINIHK